MVTLAEKEKERFSYHDYCKWSGDERWEIIDGIVYDMTPAPSRRHQELSGEIFGQIYNYLKDR